MGEGMVRVATDRVESVERMPALFIGHGNPMNAIVDNEFSRIWQKLGKALGKPRAILCISAHWETIGSRVTAMSQPRTIHDFGGFPKALFDVEYPAPGDPALAALIAQSVSATVTLDSDWGFDHGAWSVLCRLFPAADVPVVQLSLDRDKSPAAHYELGKSLAPLRDSGVLIIGSGNIVHNLARVRWAEEAYDWAREFDEDVKRHIFANSHRHLIDYPSLGRNAGLAIPTPEHFLPLLYILALQTPLDPVNFLAEKVTLGAIAMTSLCIGG